MKRKTKEPDWKKIAITLSRDSIFAIEHLKPRDGGGGILVDMKTGKMRSWKERFADNIELIPGLTVDREAMFACGLPSKERQKWFKNRK